MILIFGGSGENQDQKIAAFGSSYQVFLVFGRACLISVRVTSCKLQRLASLPTATPESAGLCAWGPASIVSLPLPISGRV
ncbi:hypothetical protein E3W21_06300 [Pseudomonas sp. F01002]|nr:hypothetical protein E3W21_06300 [Pseudomonas sp. F01002]